jgi:hypothetical protein
MQTLTVALVLLALVGFAALGRLVARWLAWAEEIQDETEFVRLRRRWNKGTVQSAVDEMRAAPPPKQEPDLYHRLMRALIEGPEDRK